MAQIKVYRKNDKVLIELTNGTTFLGGADGQFVAENGTGSDQVNIKHAEGGNKFIIKDVKRGDIHDGITDTDIGSDRDTCVSLLNSKYFNRNAPINFEIFVKNSGPAASKGDLLELVSHDGDEKPICQTTTNTNNNAVFMAMEDIASQGTGKATPLGTVTGVDTSGETIGDVIYVSDTGTFTTTKPSVRQQAVGYITKVDASDGEVFVNIGSRNSTDVTLAGAYNYLTLAGQEITLGQVDYTTDVSNTPTIPASGVDFDPVGTDNSTDVTLSGAYNYLTLAGQQITLGQVDYTTDISNTPTIPTSGVDFDPVGTDNSTDVEINPNANDVLRMNAGQVLGVNDAGADKLVFWDDSEGKLTYATIGTHLTMTGTTLSASGGGGGGGGGSANMSQTFSAPTNTGEFQDGARLVTDAYGTAPAATAGTLVSFGTANVQAVGAQSGPTATGMLTVVTDAASGDELLVEGVVKLSTATTTSLLPTTTKKGSAVYMSTTAGAVTNTAPSTAGDLVRVVGHVVDATNRTIYFKPDNTWLEL